MKILRLILEDSANETYGSYVIESPWDKATEQLFDLTLASLLAHKEKLSEGSALLKVEREMGIVTPDGYRKV